MKTIRFKIQNLKRIDFSLLFLVSKLVLKKAFFPKRIILFLFVIEIIFFFFFFFLLVFLSERKISLLCVSFFRQCIVKKKKKKRWNKLATNPDTNPKFIFYIAFSIHSCLDAYRFIPNTITANLDTPIRRVNRSRVRCNVVLPKLSFRSVRNLPGIERPRVISFLLRWKVENRNDHFSSYGLIYNVLVIFRYIGHIDISEGRKTKSVVGRAR